MQQVTRLAAPLAVAALLAACGGPSQDRIEQSIVDNYEAEGYEDISVSLNPEDDGGYTGEVEFTIPDSGETRNLACTVEPAEGTEASWRCAPRASDLAQLIVDGYTERGASQVFSELTAQSETQYAGHVEYTDPRSGQRIRHDCTVDLANGDANWQCAP